MNQKKFALGVFLGVAVLVNRQAAAEAETPLLGLGRISGVAHIFDIDPDTGAASNPRSTGVDELLVGITLSPEGTLYSLSAFAGTQGTDSVFTIDPATGATQLVGPTGLDNIFEGDLDFDPTTGVLYGLEEACASFPCLFTIDPNTGTATALGPIAVEADLSAMAFDAAGTLYVLDTTNEMLLTVDPSDASILSSLSLDRAIDILAGMDFHPQTGVLYLADDTLYTVDTVTGMLTSVGPTGLVSGLAGLEFIPEPATGLLLALGACVVLRRRRGA